MLKPLACLIFLLAPLAAVRAQEGAPMPAARAIAIVDSTAHAYYEAKFGIYPAYATSKGVGDYDSLLSTFERGKVRKFVVRTRRLKRELLELPQDSLDIQTWIDMKALVADMSAQDFWLEDFALPRKSPIPYVDACTGGLYYLTVRDPDCYGDPDFAKRLRAFGQVFAEARRNLTEPIRLHCEIAAASARAFLPYLDALRDPSGPASGHLDPGLVDTAYSQMEGFAAYLDSISAGADGEFALGRDALVAVLSEQHLIDESPEQIVAYAEQVLSASKAKLAALGAPARAAPVDVDSAIALTRSDILDLYRVEADSALAFLKRKNLATLRETPPVRVVETPAFIRVLVPGYAYEPPGPLGKDQTGLFYVPLGESLGVEAKIAYKRAAQSRAFRTVVAHELWPGHHLQMVTANAHTSFTRRLQANNFMAEGWALYCEEMMAEEGYLGPAGAREVLGGLVFRAARAVVDVKLQLGQMSLEQAVDYMVAATGRDRAFLEREVRRYAVDPTQPMSYLMGKKAILEIRERLKSLRRDAFSLKEFHDMLLSCGTIPPYLLRICVAAKATGRR